VNNVRVALGIAMVGVNVCCVLCVMMFSRSSSFDRAVIAAYVALLGLIIQVCLGGVMIVDRFWWGGRSSWAFYLVNLLIGLVLFASAESGLWWRWLRAR
jgi:hypothetical protein